MGKKLGNGLAMQNEKRNFFRMNVEMPLWLEPLDDEGQLPNVLDEPVLSPQDKKRFQQACQTLETLFRDETHRQNGAVHLFLDLDTRVNFLVWLLDHLMQGQNPKLQSSYYERLDADRLITLPEGSGESAVFPLIHAFYYQVDALIASLIDSIEKSVDGKVFIYAHALFKPFSAERYLHNLPQLAKQGNWLARVLTSLMVKLNVYECAYIELKNRLQALSDPDRWPMTPLNLSRGGFAIETEQSYDIGQKLCVLAMLEEEMLHAQAKVISVQSVGGQSGENSVKRNRVSFEFTQISADNQSHITQFVSSQELAFAHPELQ